MAKRTGSDNSGISMLALVRQVLIDGKVHTLKQIAEHMQHYMFKGMPIERVQDTVRMLLDHHSQIEKTSKGYRLRSGSNLVEVVREVLADALAPLSEKEIVKNVAKRQGVPQDMIRLQLEEDDKLAVVSYSSTKFYYLAARKQVNEKVYRLLKNRNRAMTLEEIYETLETEEGLKPQDIIYLAREDKRVVKTSNKYALKKKAKPKPKPAEPRHLVNRAEMEKVITYLEQNPKRMTAQELSDLVLGLPLEQTNLRFKLARDPRIKREDDLFYHEVEKVEREVPLKVKEKISRDFFKVKARMMGSTEIHTIQSLLDRVFGVNLATQEYEFYEKELENHLLSDDETVLLLDDGWIHKSNEPRAHWMPGEEFMPVHLPSPASPLQEEKLSPAEKAFLSESEKLESFLDDDSFAIRITALDRKYGIVRFRSEDASHFPESPVAYEIVLDTQDDEFDAIEGFLLMEQCLIRGLEVLFSERLPFEGGIMILTPNPEHPFKFRVRLETVDEPCSLTRDRMNVLHELVDSDWMIADLIRALFSSSKEKFLSCHQIWMEVNLVRQASREDILATLKDYNCFLPIKSMDGYYSFDELAGTGRLSARDEIPAVEETPAVIETAVTPVDDVKETVAAQEMETVTPDKTMDSDAEALKKAKSKQKAKKEQIRKRKREVELPPEELPEHLLKLKAFERKLPKLKAARPDVSTTVRTPIVERPVRIGAVSTGRPQRTKGMPAYSKPETADTQVLVDVPPMPDQSQTWDTTSFVNPQRGKGYAELQTTFEVLKSFISRTPIVRRTDGSIVLFLDKNDIAIYFRIPPENQDCWLAWIPESCLNSIRDADIWIKAGQKKAKKSDNGYWWATDKFKGPKGNFRDKNVLEGFEIVGKLLELMEQEKI